MARPRLDAARVAAVAPVLAREAGDEARVVAQVAPPQPPRLLREAERPLEAQALEAPRGLGDEAGVEVERGADADEDRRVEPRAHPGHPLLLLGHADADPHDLRAGRVDLV